MTIRKSPRKRESTTSLLSSAEMAQLKAPEDVLGLGRFLARQLEVDEGVDTLSRWMAHHLAGLMVEAAGAKGDKKKRLDSEVVGLIFQIWERRRDLPSGRDPLSPYQKAADTLAALRPASSAFSAWSSFHPADDASLTLEIYELSSRLALVGIADLIPRTMIRFPAEVTLHLSSAESAFLINIGEVYSLMAKHFDMHSSDTAPSSLAPEALEAIRASLLEQIQNKVGELQRRRGDKASSTSE